MARPGPTSIAHRWGSVTRVDGADELSRRSFLGGGASVAVGLIGGCASGRDLSKSRTTRSAGSQISTSQQRATDLSIAAESAGDVALVVDAIASEEALGNFGARAAKTHPQLATLLQPVRARGEAHAELLRAALVNVEPPQVRLTTRVPRAEQATRTKLVALISNAEQRRLADCLASESGALARVFASMSASHAAAGTLMRETPAGPSQ